LIVAERLAHERRRRRARRAPRGHLQSRELQERLRGGLKGKQRVHLAAQRRVSGTRRVEKRRALARLSVERCLVEAFHCRPAFHRLVLKGVAFERPTAF
jgi:hypothetical protein